MVEKLRRNWIKLGKRYTADVKPLESIWDQIEANYTDKKRHYHGLSHLNYMIDLTEENSDFLQDKDAVLFAVWFHDIVYKATKSDNEEESAVIAIKKLQAIGVDNEKIKKAKDLILSTDGHKIIVDTDEDNAYFLDFDLAILGQDWSVYETYIQNIRKEYSIYPDLLYKPGRKKILSHFLDRETLYFTEKYRDLFEAKARENLTREIKLLS